MAILEPNEYDISYFDGDKATYRHNAGYSNYDRWQRFDGVNSTGEFWKDYAQKWVNNLALSGKKVLEIGCAKGFLIKDLRDMGVNAYGMDVSQYAIDNCEPEVAPYLTVGDARTSLSKYKNKEWDVVVSFRFLECISDQDLPSLVTQLNRISKIQVHIVDDFTKGDKSNAAQYYNQHTQQEWLNNFNWSTGTRIIAQENLESILTK